MTDPQVLDQPKTINRVFEGSLHAIAYCDVAYVTRQPATQNPQAATRTLEALLVYGKPDTGLPMTPHYIMIKGQEVEEFWNDFITYREFVEENC